MKRYKNSSHWFRKGLRLHDNPSFSEACLHSERVYPLFILDPSFQNIHKIGNNRFTFLFQSLLDLDLNLDVALDLDLYVGLGSCF